MSGPYIPLTLSLSKGARFNRLTMSETLARYTLG